MGDRCRCIGDNLLYRQDVIGKVARMVRGVHRGGLRYLVARIKKEMHLPGARGYVAKYGVHDDVAYRRFLKKYATTEEEYIRQREKYTRWINNGEELPVFHFVTAVYNTKLTYIRELMDSLEKQTADNWDVTFAESSVDNGTVTQQGQRLRTYIRKRSQADQRIHLLINDQNDGISENTNIAIREVMRRIKGDARRHFICFVDHDDILSWNAVYEITKVVLQGDDIKLIYSDEDKMTDKHRFLMPNFKPDYSPQYIESVNYICHLTTVREDVVAKVGLLRREYDGAQDYDFVLRCVDEIQNRHEIFHISKVLYHWREHPDSTALNPESKAYAFRAGKRAIDAHFKRLGVPAKAKMTDIPGMYRTSYTWRKSPHITVVIYDLEKEDTRVHDRCVTSVQKQTYENYDIIEIENNDNQIYADFLNSMKSDYILFVRSAVEMVWDDALQHMMNMCLREDVGVVGAKIVDRHNKVRSAGLISCGENQFFAAYEGLPANDMGYIGRLSYTNNYSAVSMECMLLKRELLEKKREKRICFTNKDAADIGCEAWNTGLSVCYEPRAVVKYILRDVIQKANRGQMRINTDMFYSPNLTVRRTEFSLKE